jgi:hypothetical protein
VATSFFIETLFRTIGDAGEAAAQIFNLVYRRLVVGWPQDRSEIPGVREGLQNTILRYTRLKICATPSDICGQV